MRQQLMLAGTNATPSISRIYSFKAPNLVERYEKSYGPLNAQVEIKILN